jgi:hypothetical protein
MANEDIKYQFFLNGTEVLPPKEWMDIEIESAFDDNIQAYLSIDALTFIPQHFAIIDNWTSQHGFFEGCPMEIRFFDGTTIQKIDYCLDFARLYEIISPVERKIGLKQNNSLNGLMERLEAFSFEWLSEQKDANNNYYIVPTDYVDIPITIKKRFDGTEVALIAVSFAFLSFQIHYFVKETRQRTVEKISILTSAPTQKPAEIIKAIGFLLLLLAYAAAMAIVMYNLIINLYKNLAPNNTKYKGITLRKGMEIACRFLGYSLDCDIPEIDKYVYMPTKNHIKVVKNRREHGLPTRNDFGYMASEFWEIIRMLFMSKSMVIGSTVYVRALKSDFWYNQSKFVLKDSLELDNYRYNTDEMSANYLISFAYDNLNEYSYPIEDEVTALEKSTNLQVITELKTIIQKRNKLNKGLTEKNIPLQLATSRNKLSPSETALKGLLKLADLFNKLFHAQPISGQIDLKKGRVMLSQAQTSVPMIIPLVNGYMPNNPAEHLGAKYLYNNYHWWASFVDNADMAQHKVFTDKKIAFSFADFIETSKNGAFTTPDSKKGKFTSIKWRPAMDEATASFWIAEKYTDNLQSIIVES